MVILHLDLLVWRESFSNVLNARQTAQGLEGSKEVHTFYPLHPRYYFRILFMYTVLLKINLQRVTSPFLLRFLR